jgi:hypothetical protein
MEDEFDISWLLEQERIENMEENCYKEPLPYIHIISIYINEKNEIETIDREKIDVSGINVFKKEKLLQFVQSKKKYTPNSKFTLKETLWFHVDLDPSQIQPFSIKTELKTDFLHHYPILEDIPLSPSIFIFHNINALYFIFTETPMIKYIKPHSILKKEYHNKTKKKVEIQIPNIQNIKTTRKKTT